MEVGFSKQVYNADSYGYAMALKYTYEPKALCIGIEPRVAAYRGPMFRLLPIHRPPPNAYDNSLEPQHGRYRG